MIFGLETIKTDLHNIQKSLDEAKELVPPAENLEEIEPDENISKEDLRFLKRCCQILMKLGYIKSQYEFSEQFLGKNRPERILQQNDTSRSLLAYYPHPKRAQAKAGTVSLVQTRDFTGGLKSVPKRL